MLLAAVEEGLAPDRMSGRATSPAPRAVVEVLRNWRLEECLVFMAG